MGTQKFAPSLVLHCSIVMYRGIWGGGGGEGGVQVNKQEQFKTNIISVKKE